MLIELHGESEAIIQRRLETGRYASAEDVVKEAIGKLGPPAEQRRREGGQWRGQVRVAADFDDLPSDIAAAFGMQ